jgi:hypothetical protein
MSEQKLKTRDALHVLSLLTLSSTDSHVQAFEFCRDLDGAGLCKLIQLARDHHVTVRICTALTNFAKAHKLERIPWAGTLLADETAQIRRAIPTLAQIYQELEQAGLPALVIKSFDHWPDVGSDFDFYVDGPSEEIQQIMQQKFGAKLQRQSWSDRVARKWNFSVPGTEKIVEIQAGRLGQTGEHVRVGRELVQRKITKTFGGHEFAVPCPEHQLLLAVLNSFYRHYYLRICDVANTVQLIQQHALNFEMLRRESKHAGIRRGLATYLAVVEQYYAHYSDERLTLPQRILKGASFGVDKIYAQAGYLRVPLFPQSAELYTRELAKAIKRKDLKKTARISLLPGLAVAAGAKFRITGKDKGIW